MTNWLYIYEGKVVHIIDQELCPAPEDYADGIHDTVAQDDSKTFVIGDDFTADLQLQYNKQLWIERGWLSNDVATTTDNMIPQLQKT